MLGDSMVHQTSRSVGLAFACMAALFVTAAKAEDLQYAEYGVAVQYDAVYGSALVGATSGKPHSRDLKMDVYRPVSNGKALSDRPAVILAFGGGLHRGSKGNDHFEEDGASDTPMGAYCHTFAAAGYACFSIEYRLVPEDPVPPANIDTSKLLPKALLIEPGLTARINYVRGRMGLQPLDDKSRDQLFNTMVSSTEDMATAISFVRANAAQFGVDPDRLAIGGFSAGGFAAINAAYAKHVPVAAVFSLSGPMGGYDLRTTARADMPPLLFVMGQNDLDGVRASAPKVLVTLKNAGIEADSAWIPGFGHFYPKEAPSLGTDLSKLTLERRLLDFLDRTLAAKAH